MYGEAEKADILDSAMTLAGVFETNVSEDSHGGEGATYHDASDGLDISLEYNQEVLIFLLCFPKVKKRKRMCVTFDILLPYNNNICCKLKLCFLT